MKILGFSGKKQGGKTTAIRDLCYRLGDDVDIINFADALKDLIFRFFAAPTKEYANTAWEPFESEESKGRTHPCGKTYRELLQIVGTDWCRTLWPNMWIENYKFRATIAEEETILTADVRFPNEVKCIQDLGGHVIRLLRAPFPDDRHESETALDWLDGEFYNPPKTDAARRIYQDIFFNAFIDNRKMSIEEQNEAVWKLVNEREWL